MQLWHAIDRILNAPIERHYGPVVHVLLGSRAAVVMEGSGESDGHRSKGRSDGFNGTEYDTERVQDQGEEVN